MKQRALVLGLMAWSVIGVLLVSYTTRSSDRPHSGGHFLSDRRKAERSDLEDKRSAEAQEAPRRNSAAVDDGKTEAERVYDDFPYLQYDPRGEEACREANEQYYTQHDAVYGNTKHIDGVEGLHLFFTTDCSQHSLWQAMTLENTWAKVRHPGALTRVVSGCFSSDGRPRPNQKLLSQRVIEHPKFFIFYGPKVGGAAPKSLKSCGASEAGWYEGDIINYNSAEGIDGCKVRCRGERQCVSYNFRHGDKQCYLFKSRTTFHDDASHSTGTCTGNVAQVDMPSYIADYPPINRPLTAMYWLYNSKPVEKVLGLLDPDMVFVRPLMFHIGAHPVEKGRPVGQYYSYLNGNGWDKYYPQICTDHHDGLCPAITDLKAYSPGPPHFMHRDDWKEVAVWWVRYTVDMRRVWGEWVSEMGGFSAALARMDLGVKLVTDGMWDGESTDGARSLVADLVSGSEDWILCANENEICSPRLAPGSTVAVRFGLNPTHDFSEANAKYGDTIVCSHRGSIFPDNDPAAGQEKRCWYSTAGLSRGKDLASLRDRANWVYCGNENAGCYLPQSDAPFTVRFGDHRYVGMYVEKKGVAPGTIVQCRHNADDALAFAERPSVNTGVVAQCYYKTEGDYLPPPTTFDHFSEGVNVMPALWHYCFTFETSRDGFDESFWKLSPKQRAWEDEHGEPSLRYWHWSKYRALTDWGGQEDAPTLLMCDMPLLFENPPLPTMMQAPYATAYPHQRWFVYYSHIASEINQAMTRYKAQICGGQMNLHRHVRTSHKDWWFSRYETIMDANGHRFLEVPKKAFENLRYSKM